MIKKIAFLFVAGFLISFMVSVPANAASITQVQASARPGDCSYGYFKDRYGNEGTKAICKTGNRGYYRAVVQCLPVGGGPIVWREAPVWRAAGSGITSYVYCPPMTVYSTSGIVTKGS